MTFVIPAAQALGCAAELRRRASDSDGAKQPDRLAQCEKHPKTETMRQKKNKSG
jgi:hypothetical protein